jgi:hypothetical protein
MNENKKRKRIIAGSWGKKLHRWWLIDYLSKLKN